MGGPHLLGWIKLSALPLVPVVSRSWVGEKLLPNASRSWAKPSRSTHHPPQRNVQLPPPKKNTCFSASKPQLVKKWLIFCNPLICRENAHPNKLLIWDSLGPTCPEKTPETFDTSSEGLIELDHQTSIQPCLSYGFIIQQPKTPKTKKMHKSRMIPYCDPMNEKPGQYIQ